jgi:hypothetical protein
MGKGTLLAYLGTALVLIAILVVLILDIDGWGTFALDIAKSLAVQLIATMVLLGLVLAIVEERSRASYFGPSRYVVTAIFILAPVLALPVLPIVFKRPIDVYDGIQTLILTVVFYSMAGQYRDDFWRRSLGRRSARSREPDFTFPSKPSEPIQPIEREREDLYQNLLRKVTGDRRIVERLIAYERSRAPHASTEELLRSAIIRWERDNR